MAAALGAFGEPFPLVVSGISAGRNTGQSVIHSGTVGAALTALTFGAHGLAVSLDPSDPWHWDTAAQLAVATAGWIMSAERQPLTLNLNSPSVPDDQVLGLRMAELDGFGYFRVAAADESGRKLQLEMSGEGEITETEGSDTCEYVNSTWPHHGGLSWPHLLGCGRGGSWWYRSR